MRDLDKQASDTPRTDANSKLHAIARYMEGLENFDDAEFLRQVAEELTALLARLDEAERYRWLPIETAPKDNKRLLLLATFDEKGELITTVDHNGMWDFETDGWEHGNSRHYFWKSAFDHNEDPTHWMYQPEWYSAIDSAMGGRDAA